MKTDIHPTYYPNATMTCACGNVVTAGSTVESVQIELCSKCHPFYTGKQKLIDTARRVEKYQEKVAARQEKAATTVSKKEKAAKRASKRAEKLDKQKKELEKLQES